MTMNATDELEIYERDAAVLLVGWVPGEDVDHDAMIRDLLWQIAGDVIRNDCQHELHEHHEECRCSDHGEYLLDGCELCITQPDEMSDARLAKELAFAEGFRCAKSTPEELAWLDSLRGESWWREAHAR